MARRNRATSYGGRKGLSRARCIICIICLAANSRKEQAQAEATGLSRSSQNSRRPWEMDNTGQQISGPKYSVESLQPTATGHRPNTQNRDVCFSSLEGHRAWTPVREHMLGKWRDGIAYGAGAGICRAPARQIRVKKSARDVPPRGGFSGAKPPGQPGQRDPAGGKPTMHSGAAF